MGVSARPFQRHVLVQDELEDAGERGFHRGNVDFAVALARVPIADLEQRAGRLHWNEQRGSGDEFFVVQIARVSAGRTAVYFSGNFHGRKPHAPEKRPQGDLDPWSCLLYTSDAADE